MSIVTNWIYGAPILLVGAVVLALMALAAAAGGALRQRHERAKEMAGDFEGYIVSAVLGLLALLLGFTFALAVDRFDTRRILVLQESNAIGTTYLRTQLLEEPHRARISGLLVAYTDNRLALASATTDNGPSLLAENDRLITELWTATSSAFLTIKGLDFSSAYLESMNNLIDLDAARKAARRAHVPTEVFIVLIIYMTMTAAVLGYVASGRRGRVGAMFMLTLLVLSMMLTLDIDRPTRGGIQESQEPMERLRESMKAQPISVYDRYRIQDARPAPP